MPDGVDLRQTIEPLLDGCWLLKMNEDEFDLICAWCNINKDAPLYDRLMLLGDRLDAAPEYLVVTRAEAGAAMVATRCADSLIEARGVKVDVADTVGAGDAFTARLVYGLLDGEDAHDALSAATKLGSWVATQQGATPKHDAAAIAAL